MYLDYNFWMDSQRLIEDFYNKIIIQMMTNRESYNVMLVEMMVTIDIKVIFTMKNKTYNSH